MIVKCSHCKKMFPAESFDSHICDLPMNSVKRIEVVYFCDDSYREKKLMTGWGVDGITYTFEVVPRKLVPVVMTTDEFLHKKRTDGDLTEPLNFSLNLCLIRKGSFLKHDRGAENKQYFLFT